MHAGQNGSKPQTRVFSYTGVGLQMQVSSGEGRLHGPRFYVRCCRDEKLPFPRRGGLLRQWPGAVLYEIWDVAHLGRAHAARVGGAAWEPRDADGRWKTSSCPG